MQTTRGLKIPKTIQQSLRNYSCLRTPSEVRGWMVKQSSKPVNQEFTRLKHTGTSHFPPFRRQNSTCTSSIATEKASRQTSLFNHSSQKVALPLDGEIAEFSAVLLRDACSCQLCVHESSRQRLFSTIDIPSDIQARAVELDATSDSVSIRWDNDVPGYDDDHNTKLNLASLRELSRTGSLPSTKDSFPPKMLWGRDPLQLLDYDFSEYMEDDKTLYRLIEQLQVQGLAFISNVPGEEESLAKIATRIGPVKDTFYGYTWDVRTVPQAINAAYTSNDLGFHTDLLYFEQLPHIQLLHCIQSASTGGASVFADACKAAVELFRKDPDAFDILTTVPVNYHYNHPNDNVYRTTKPVIDLHPLRVGNTIATCLTDYIELWNERSTRNGGFRWDDSMLVSLVDKINWGPPFLAPFSNHLDSTHQEQLDRNSISVLNDKVDKWHRAAAKFDALLQSSEYQYERVLKPGECVLFNNTSTLHSRRAFDAADMGKPRWLRGTYVDKDPFFSKMRVLKQKFE